MTVGRSGAASRGCASSSTRSPRDLDPARVPASWSGKARWAHRLIRRWIGDEPRRASWPVFEQEAARRVEAALDRLAGLDAVEAAPSLDVFRRTLELELAAARERIGRLGEGVLVGPVGFALGADLDRLFVCGLAEGVFPAAPRDDPLLERPRARRARRRAAAAGRSRAANDHRGLLAALAATSGDRVLCFPRGDLRRSTEHVPSRGSSSTPREALSGARRARSGAPPWCTPIASFVDGLARVAFPATAHEHDVRTVLAAATVERRRTSAGASCSRPAGVTTFTRFDGNLADLARPARARVGPSAPGHRSLSPTRLETWVALPARVLHALRARRRRRRAARGHHRAPTHRPRIDRPRGARPVRRRTADRRRNATACTRSPTRSARTSPTRGLSGRGICSGCASSARSTTRSTRGSTPTHAYRAEYGLRTLATEHRFGPTARSRFPTGARCASAAAIDRVDAADDGRLFVFDYKTGKPYRDSTPTIPLEQADPAAASGVRARRTRAAERAATRRSRRTTGSSAGARTSGSATPSTTTTEAVFDATLQRDRRRHRGGYLPRAARPSRPAVLGRLRVLRPRSPRHRRSLARLVAQGARAGARGLRRARPVRSSDRDGPQPSLFDAGHERRSGARLGSATDLADTLFVEAGAGTGKTAALVGRIVGAGAIRASPMRAIAAITFTEKAAAELRYRVRAELETPRRCRPDVRGRALDELDAAAICTLHAFAQRLLTEFPIEAGLPPRIEVRDEIASAVAFDARWERFVDRLLDEPEHQAASSCSALAAGVKFQQLRAVAEAFADNWDLLDRVPRAARSSRMSSSTAGSPTLEAALRGTRPMHRRRRQVARAPRRARGVRRSAARRARHRRPHRAAAAREAVVQGRQRRAARARGAATSTTCAIASSPARRPAPGSVLDGVATRSSAHYVGRARRLHARGRRRTPAGGRARVPRPARARAACCSATRTHGAAARRPARATLPAPARRRVPGHRPDPGRHRGAARVRRSRRRTRARGPRSRSSRAASSSSATRSSRSTGSGAPTSRPSSTARDTFADAPLLLTSQLPHDRAGAGVGQPRVRRAHPAVPRFAARVPRARGDARGRRRAARR